MPAMIFSPHEDITTQDLGVIMGFVTMGLIEDREQRVQEIKKGLKQGYTQVCFADRSMILNRTITISENIYNSMPYNLRKHFTAY